MKKMTFNRKGKIMRNFLSKINIFLTFTAFCLCMVLLFCPLQAQAAVNLEVTVESPTNEDHIFTGGEVFDLTVYLQGDAEETYYISYKIIDSRKLAIAQSQTPIEVTLTKEGRGELLLNLASVKGRDTFRAEITDLCKEARAAAKGE
jgi:hypothetical protein